jgi:hypothetical protein
MALMTAGYVHAVGIGDISVKSSIGQPLRAEVKILATGEDRLRESCFRLVPTPEAYDDIPTVTRARISLQSRGGQSYIVISGSEPVSHPILRLSLQAGCDIGLTREFMLLMPSPADLPVASEPAAPGTPARGRSSGVDAGPPPAIVGQWQAAEGESLQSIAESLYPDDRRAQQRFIRAAVQVNPSLFEGDGDPASQPLRAGTILNMPSLKASAPVARRPAAAEPRQMAAPRPAPVEKVERPKAPAAQAGSLADRPHPLLEKLRAQPAETDRLQVGVAPAGPSGTPGTQPSDEASKEQKLVAQLEDQLAAYQAIIDKINKMESYANDLKEQLLRIETEIEAASQAAATPSATSVPSASVAAQAEQKSPAPALTVETAAAPKPTRTGLTVPDWLVGALAGTAAIGILAFLSRRRGKEASSPALENPTLPMPDKSAEHEDTGLPLMRETATAPSTAPAYSGSNVVPFTPRDDEGSIDVSEHESAMELAEIMLSFGRVKAAAQVLHDYVDSNPKASVQPWLKLLELYREAGMRHEFEAGAQRLNRLFNVKRMQWDGEGESAEIGFHSLERFGHIRDRLVASWGTADCLEYLHRLLDDNRNGSRSGFSLPVLDEILLLIAILEEHRGAPLLEKVGRAA